MSSTPEAGKTDDGARPPERAASDTPLMRQYHALKAKNPDAILFFRLGDFYELFFDDARKAAPLLEVVLTQRQGVPMCGVPHHALAGYLAKLLRHGLRIAVAEQMEDPAAAKGMVARDVVRVVTPGTVLEEELLPAKQNNFLAAVAPAKGSKAGGWGLAALDMSTGEFLLTAVDRDPDGSRLADELARLDPREVLHPRAAPVAAPGRPITPVEDRLFAPAEAERLLLRAFETAGLAGFGVDPKHPALPAAGAVLAYVERSRSGALAALQPPRVYSLDDCLVLDDAALRHLDLYPTDRAVRGDAPSTLWDVIDHTATPMGGRRLKWWLLHPLKDADAVRRRQDRVAYLADNPDRRRNQTALLRDAADVERVLGRLTAGGATGRDLNALRRTLTRLPDLAAVFSAAPFLPEDLHPLKDLLASLAVPEALTGLLRRALTDDPPLRLADGGVIRDGYSPELDELRGLAKSGRTWISEMETRERQRTGIQSLKVGYNAVFGYYLEVSRANLAKAPPEWTRKQTMANAERYITPELKAQEDRILGAEEKSRALEAELFAKVRAEVLAHRAALRRLADALSELDSLASLAEAAERGRWRRPRVTDGHELSLKNARHPVVERALAGKTPFVPNDAVLDGSEDQILLVTGPNMGGKSTYLRQVALIVILAQMGSYVPAESAEVGVVDRVFTRIGAGDNLAAGASTFLVEMQEVANILHNATPRSLIVLDEVGRGTSTYDGVAVAWAVVEYLHRPDRKTGPKVLFATHYFELTDLARRLPGVKNFHAAVREWVRPDGKTELVFLHQILPGPADRSYGVHVAQMAGLPASCVSRAKVLLRSLEAAGPKSRPAEETEQLDLFSAHPVLEEIRAVDPDALTPMEALQLIHRFARELAPKDGEKS
jgi:DNA mismatch repair protein MutS